MNVSTTYEAVIFKRWRYFFSKNKRFCYFLIKYRRREKLLVTIYSYGIMTVSKNQGCSPYTKRSVSSVIMKKIIEIVFHYYDAMGIKGEKGEER